MGGLCKSLVCGLPGAKGTEEQSTIGESFSFPLPGAKGTEEQSTIGESFSFPFSFNYFLGFGMITQAGFLTQRPDTREGITTALASSHICVS